MFYEQLAEEFLFTCTAANMSSGMITGIPPGILIISSEGLLRFVRFPSAFLPTIILIQIAEANSGTLPLWITYKEKNRKISGFFLLVQSKIEEL